MQKMLFKWRRWMQTLQLGLCAIYLESPPFVPICPTAIHYKQSSWFNFFARTLNYSIGVFVFQRSIKYWSHFSQDFICGCFKSRTSFLCLFKHILCVCVAIRRMFLSIHLKILTALKVLFRVTEMCLYARLLPSSHFKCGLSCWQELKFLLRVMLCHWLWFLWACKACITVKRWILNSCFRNNIRSHGAKYCQVNRLLAPSGVFSAS